MSDNIEINLGEQDWQEVIINEQLQLHITTHQDGICIDYYKYRNQNEETDNFDDDFIGSRYFLWNELGDKP